MSYLWPLCGNSAHDGQWSLLHVVESNLCCLSFCACVRHTREDPPRGTKTMSCFHTQKWSRVKAFAQWLGATGCLALDRVPRAMVWRDKAL